MRQAQESGEKCPAPPAFSREVMRAQGRRESHASESHAPENGTARQRWYILARKR